MRINKFLSQYGIASRRKIDEMIADKRIKVNYSYAVFGQEIIENDVICIDNKEIKINKSNLKEYYILNKPLEVISASSDDRNRKTVVDFIKTDARIYPIGRLDYNTSGLILLTNDGEIFNKLIHPRKEIYKKYRVKILGEIKKEEIEKFKNGIFLDDGKTLPALVDIIKIYQNKSELFISIREGRNRQVRRMFDKLGYRVLSLHRESIGNIDLGNLKIGEYRKLNSKEIEYLYSL